MKNFSNKLFTSLFGILLTVSLFAQESADEKAKVNFKFSGYLKTDVMFSQYNNGALSSRDIYTPSVTPVGDSVKYRYLDFHSKQSRFNFDVSTMIGQKKLHAFIEMDFFGGGGNEVVTNSYNARIRHAFIEYDKILVGQTWSTFMIVELPEALDLLGVPEGVVIVRQPMIRYSSNGWQISIENPYLTYISLDKTIGNTSETNLLPDLIIRKNLSFENGNISVAAIGRQLSYYDSTRTIQSSFGGGVSVGGKLNVGSKDDVKFIVTAGKGLGRYLGLGFINSAAVDSSLALKPISSVNGYLAYRHFWTEKLRSTASFSYFEAFNDIDITGGDANQKSMSVAGNLVYSPAPKLDFGLEGRYCVREIADGTTGDFFRIQFSAKYAFSFKTSEGN